MYSITEDVMTSTALTPSAKLIWACVRQHIEKNPDGNLSYETIAKRTATTATSAMTGVKLLIKVGLIESYKDDRGWRFYK